MCVCTYIHMYIYIYTYVYTYIYMHRSYTNEYTAACHTLLVEGMMAINPAIMARVKVTHPTLEPTQGQILSQSPTDSASGR